MPVVSQRKLGVSSAGQCTGVAWLSSARVVRCMVKSHIERNPYPVLDFPIYRDDVTGNCLGNGEEGEDDVKSVLPLRLGRHTRYNGRYNRLRRGNPELILKTGLSSDWGLKPDPMKLESLVIAGQPYGGEYVLGSCTHRPSIGESWECPNSDLSEEGRLSN